MPKFDEGAAQRPEGSMAVRAYILIEADQTRVAEIKESLPEIDLEGSRVVACDVVTGPYDLIATVESTDIAQLGR